MLKEFQDFALKGNVLDMAVGIIIGAAFTTIVSSLVEDVIMPPIGMNVPPKDLSTPQARAELSRARMLDSVTHGRSGTAMISYRDQLKKSEIEAVVDYVRAAIMIPESSISGTSAHAGRDGTLLH